MNFYIQILSSALKRISPKANLKTVNYSPNIADHVSKGFVDLALLPFYDEKGTYYIIRRKLSAVNIKILQSFR